jgi:hypothetical protein
MALKKAGSKPNGSLIKELDAAIALLTHVRSLAVAATESEEGKRQSKMTDQKRSKRTLSQEGREAIAAAQRKRWAKVKRQKRLAR